MNIEKESPARRMGFPVTVLRDSHFLDYVKASSALKDVRRLRHWMIETFDGTLNVVCEEAPHTEFVPNGWNLHKPEESIRIEPPRFPRPYGLVAAPD